MSTILDEIIANKREEVAAAKSQQPLTKVLETIKTAPPARDFFKALRQGPQPRIIAECKRKSPSRGIMKADYDPVSLAQAYEQGGAAAISVLTDEKYFGGISEHLVAVRQKVTVPVLRKDFIIDEYQIYEARALGADSFLLIAGVLSPAELRRLIELGRKLGMEPLVESHTEAELSQAADASAKILGINNRNLKNFSVDLEHARKLTKVLGPQHDHVLVCESGIKDRKDIENMMAVGYNVFLIGETLVTHPDPKSELQVLTSQPR